MRQLKHRLGQAGALLALAVLVGGIPWLFAATIGNPAHAWPDLRAGDLSSTVVIDVLAAIVWIAWAQFAVSVIIETYALIRRAPLPGRIPGVFSGQQHLARTLVATILLAATASITVSNVSHISALPPAGSPARPIPVSVSLATRTNQQATIALTSRRDTADHLDDRSARPLTTSTPPGQLTSTYVVPNSGDGPDTLWDIAQSTFGTGERWHEIWALNKGRTQADGTIMTDPGMLQPGWTVLIPRNPTTGSEARVTVVPGDTLTEIAIEQHTSEPDVWALNEGRVMSDGRRFTDPDLIKPGDTILIPTPHADPHSAPDSGTGRHRTRPATPSHTDPVIPRQPASHQRAPSQPTPVASPTTPRSASPTASPHEGPSPTGATHPASTRQAASSLASQIALLSAGLGLMAGGLFAALRRYRRRQLRHRPAGHTLAPTAPALRTIDAALHVTGAPAQSTLDTLECALRSLADSTGQHPSYEADLLPLITVRIDATTVRVRFATSVQPPDRSPWTATDANGWQTDRAAMHRTSTSREVRAPYPALVSAIHEPRSETLLNLAHFGATVVTGDPDRAADWLRFLAGELAHNPWADQLPVTLAALEPQLVDLNPARLAHTDDIPAAARLLDAAGDVPEILILGPGWHEQPDAFDAVTRRIPALTDAGWGHANCVVAYLPDVPTDPDGTDWSSALHVTITADGVLTVAEPGMTGPAAQLPASAAAELAALLATARGTDADTFVPGSAGDEAPTEPAASVATFDLDEAQTDTTREMTSDASDHQPPDEPFAVSSQPFEPDVLFDISTLDPADRHDQVTEDDSAVADITFVPPDVTLEIVTPTDALDPTLDADLAAWHDPSSPRAKLTLLGHVTLAADGRVPDGRIAFYTEAITYLALHTRGVTGDRFAADLWPERTFTGRDSSPKNALSIARKWLGVDPMTGLEYLPVASTATPGGVPTYRIAGLLVDWDLFRRLRARADAVTAAGGVGGVDAVADLTAALDLVSGEPLSLRRLDGYGWLRDGTVVDEDAMTVAVVDTAHTVTTAALAVGDIVAAQHAVDVALSVGASDDRPLLDLAAILDLQGRDGERAATVRRIRAHHEAEVEEDLPPRTYEVLLERGWLTG